MEILAPAKVNLSLDIIRRREDGYHELRMVMHSVGLWDVLTLERSGGTGVRVRTGVSFLPEDEGNLAAAAALCFSQATGLEVEGLSIGIDKRIPVCAGMAGGSSDAAAVLRALNARLDRPLDTGELARLGAQIGSDVPYCVLGGTALAEGRGEVLTPLPALPPCWFVLCKPGFPISTPELFRRVRCEKIRRRPDIKGQIEALERGDLVGVARRMYNVFEDVLPLRQGRQIQAIQAVLISHGALGAVMSGSGPTVFGVFDRRERAESACADLKRSYPQVFLTRSA